jgi:hypothetical protein
MNATTPEGELQNFQLPNDADEPAWYRRGRRETTTRITDGTTFIAVGEEEGAYSIDNPAELY